MFPLASPFSWSLKYTCLQLLMYSTGHQKSKLKPDLVPIPFFSACFVCLDESAVRWNLMLNKVPVQDWEIVQACTTCQFFGTTKSCGKLPSDVEQNSEPQGKKWRQQATPLGWVCTTKNSKKRIVNTCPLLKEIELNFNISADFHFHLLLFLPSACKGCTYHQRLGKGHKLLCHVTKPRMLFPNRNQLKPFLDTTCNTWEINPISLNLFVVPMPVHEVFDFLKMNLAFQSEKAIKRVGKNEFAKCIPSSHVGTLVSHLPRRSFTSWIMLSTPPREKEVTKMKVSLNGNDILVVQIAQKKVGGLLKVNGFLGKRCLANLRGRTARKVPKRFPPTKFRVIVDNIWMFPKIGVGPQNGWFLMENLIEMDDLGGKTHYFRKHPLTVFSAVECCVRSQSLVYSVAICTTWIWHILRVSSSHPCIPGRVCITQSLIQRHGRCTECLEKKVHV